MIVHVPKSPYAQTGSMTEPRSQATWLERVLMTRVQSM